MNRIIDVNRVRWTNKVSADLIGRVFFYEDKCYRAIFKNQEHRILRLLNSDLFKELEQRGMVLPTKITDISLNDEKYGIILETRKIQNIIEPTEWSFSMILDVARFIISFEKILFEYGYALQDFHPYNVMFDFGMKMYFVDLGSIVLKECVDEKAFYLAMIQKYYRPIYMWQKTGKKQSLFYLYDNVVDDYEWNSFLRGCGESCIQNKDQTIPCDMEELEELFNTFNSEFIHKTEWGHIDWNDYQEKMFDEKGNTKDYERFKIVSEYLKQYDIRAITEIAANQGAFSQYCLDENIIDYSVAIDVDENAIDKMYNRIKRGKNKTEILCGVLDLVRPISRDHYDCSERMKNDAVIAMALTHHLCIPQGLSIESAIELIASYTKKWIIVEFMPLGMWDGSGGLDTPFYYNVDNFRYVLSKNFEILVEKKIEANRILFIGRRK